MPGLKPQFARRTAIALDKDGHHLTLVVADQPIEASTLGRLLASMEFHTALMLDGGPSTQLAARLKTAGKSPEFHAEIPGGYAVPDFLVIFRRR